MSKAYKEWEEHVARCEICDADDEDECEDGKQLRLKTHAVDDDYDDRDDGLPAS